jgi:hypothetical protein
MLSASSLKQTPPAIASMGTHATIYTVGYGQEHNAEFLSRGWQQPSVYAHLYTTGQQNSSVLYDTKSTFAYAGRYLARQAAMAQLVDREIADHTLSATGSSLLRSLGTTHIIAEKPLNAPASTIKQSPDQQSVYAIVDPLIFAYTPKTVRVVKTYQEALLGLRQITGDTQTESLIEQPMTLTQKKPLAISSLVSKTTGFASFDVENTNDGNTLLVLLQSYYPGFTVTVDGKTKEALLPVNLTQSGIVITPGKHTIVLSFFPQSLTTGAMLSLLSFIALGVFSLVILRLSHIRKINPPSGSRHEGNRSHKLRLKPDALVHPQ